MLLPPVRCIPKELQEKKPVYIFSYYAPLYLKIIFILLFAKTFKSNMFSNALAKRSGRGEKPLPLTGF